MTREKCPEGCQCRRHDYNFGDERRRAIIASNKRRAGKPRKKCPEGCTCGRHVAHYRGGSRKGRKFSREAKQRIALAAIEARGKLTEEDRQRIREQLAAQRADPEFESKRREALAKHYKKIEFGVRSSSKNEYRLAPEIEKEGYVHNCGVGAVKIGRRTPDFIDLNTRRVFEFFGDYWHVPEEEQEAIDYYAELGWTCTVLWERDLNSWLADHE